MRLDEIVSLNDVLKTSQYIRILHKLRVDANIDINVTRIKNKVIQSWRQGMKSRKHYDDLLGQIDINLNKLIDK